MTQNPKEISPLVKTTISGRTGYYLASRQFSMAGTTFLVIKSEITGPALHDVNHTIKNTTTGNTKTLSMQQLIKAVNSD